jgi:hypothetical protein
MSGEEQLSAKIDKLAGVAKDANLVTAVAELQGQLVHFIDRETRAYKAQAGDGWTDQGLAEHIRQRTAEMRRCWARDVDEILTGGGPEVTAPAPIRLRSKGEELSDAPLRPTPDAYSAS